MSSKRNIYNSRVLRERRHDPLQRSILGKEPQTPCQILPQTNEVAGVKPQPTQGGYNGEERGNSPTRTQQLTTKGSFGQESKPKLLASRFSCGYPCL